MARAAAPPRRAAAPVRPTSMLFDHFEYANGDVDVYRSVPRENGTDRPASEWVAWVCVRSAGAHGKGLFAARDFALGETVGRYSGRVIGLVNDPATGRVDIAMDARINQLSSAPEGDAITDVNGVYIDARRRMQSNEVQMQLIHRQRPLMSQPEWKWPGAHVHMANDPRGTHRQSNAKLTRGGYFEAIRHIASGEELLWTYGAEAYWKDAEMLGTRNKPIYIV
jgi:hypothetical protein